MLNPADLDNVRVWFDAASIEGLADGDAVSQWDDLSGAGRHATQADSARRPLYKRDRAFPVVRFDGTNDAMQTAAWASHAQPISLAVACYPAADSAVRNLLDAGVALPSVAGRIDTNAANRWRLNFGSSVLGATAQPGALAIILAVANGASSVLTVDGATATGNANTGASTGLTLGATRVLGSFYKGDIAEVIQVDGMLSADQRDGLAEYLRERWTPASADMVGQLTTGVPDVWVSEVGPDKAPDRLLAVRASGDVLVRPAPAGMRPDVTVHVVEGSLL